MRMDENSNPEWKAMLKSSSHGRKALEINAALEKEIESLRSELVASRILEATYREAEEKASKRGDELQRRAELMRKFMTSPPRSWHWFIERHPEAAQWFKEDK